MIADFKKVDEFQKPYMFKVEITGNHISPEITEYLSLLTFRYHINMKQTETTVSLSIYDSESSEQANLFNVLVSDESVVIHLYKYDRVGNMLVKDDIGPLKFGSVQHTLDWSDTDNVSSFLLTFET